MQVPQGEEAGLGSRILRRSRLSVLKHLSGTLGTTQSGSSNFPRSGWKNPQNARPPGSLLGKVNLVVSPPSYSWKSTGRSGALQACRQMPGCPLDSPTVNADWLVLGPGLEKISFSKKSSFIFFKSGKCPHSKWCGMSSRQACIAAEDSVVLQQRGREGM